MGIVPFLFQILFSSFFILASFGFSVGKCSSGAQQRRMSTSSPPIKDGDYVDLFCRSMNSIFRSLTIEPVRNVLEIQISTEQNKTNLEVKDVGLWSTFSISKLLKPPEIPGISRPVSLVILASVPSALMWYGFYKYSVEEELFHDQLSREGRVTGCGGYGTLLPFVFLFLLGIVGGALPLVQETKIPEICVESGSLWILLTQVINCLDIVESERA